MRKVAIVTGAARGIGRACAARLAADGYQVAAVDLDDQELGGWVDGAGLRGRVEPRRLDVADAQAGMDLVADVAARHGRVDALACVAGYTKRETLDEIDTAAWNAMVAVLVRGPLFMTKAAAADMIRRGEPGAIVHVSSIRSEAAEAGQAHYCAAKGALRTAARAAAQELAPHNIRVNCVGPGLTATRMTADVRSNPTLRAQRESLVPLGRYARPEEIAGCAAFLLSSRAAYVTGATLYADGGYLAL